ncbi:MAG: hypothetical protein GY772_21045 [bacterium]|nr:hypothetical protein [bacterium]
MGRNGTAHIIMDTRGAEHVVRGCLGIAADAALTWPRDSADLADFATRLEDMVVRMRRVCCPVSGATFGRGAVSGHNRYNIKSFVRVMMGRVESHMPRAIGPVSMATVLKWTPDVRGYAQPLRSMSYDDVRHMFGGMSPMMIPYWCCLAGIMPESRVKAALKADLRAVWDVYDRHLLSLHTTVDPRDPPYPPGPRAIAQEVLVT